MSDTDELDATLTPDDESWATDGDGENEGFDVSDLRVNFSSQEAGAEPFEDLPAGKYPVIITGCKVERSNSSANKGKPYYRIEFTVQEPNKYARQKTWTNVMLWDGALYSLSMLMKALGYSVSGSMRVPQPDDLIGQSLIVRIAMGKKNEVKQEDGTTKVYDARLEVKGFFRSTGATVGASSSTSARDSLEP